MLEGLRIILILVIMGGAIAFIGDKIGTKVGKRRMSLSSSARRILGVMEFGSRSVVVCPGPGGSDTKPHSGKYPVNG